MLLITKLKQILKPELNSKSEEKEYRRRLVLIAGSLLLVGGIGLIIAENGFGWSRTGFPNKTLWDWMQLLIIPVVLAIVAIWFNRVERKNERAVARDNQQANALETYFDKMSDLLLKEDLRNSKSDAEVRKIAQARTLSTLSQLNGTRKGNLLQFLYEAGLIHNDGCIISLVHADLSSADLVNADLRGANLRSTNFHSADLMGANLRDADLSHSSLYHATLVAASMYGANLSDASLNLANLRFANLKNANLTQVQFAGADFYGANFHDANLTDATFTNHEIKEFLSEEQLKQISTYKRVGKKSYQTKFIADETK